MKPASNAPFFVDNEIIILTRNGIWLADGVEISHEPTRRLFARSLVKDTEGYSLHIGRETKRIQVEDTAYFVVRVDDGASAFRLVLNDETQEELDPSTLAYRLNRVNERQEGRLSCRIKDGSEEAKFLHSAYHDLLKNLHEDASGYFLLIHGRRVQLG